MLQIISGRFFGGGHIEERETDAILYSNLTWTAPIHTGIMELRPADAFCQSSVASYVLRFKNRLERKGILVLADPSDAVDQFRLIASFWFRAFFHPDRQRVELLCRRGLRNPLDKEVPSRLVPRFFDAELRATATEVEGLRPFVSKILSMPRKSFLPTMACLAGFFDALETISSNFDLAYSILVYVLEALSQTSADSYIPVWTDYDEATRGRLEPVLERLNPADRDELQRALMTTKQFKIKRRFVQFVSSHIEHTFFTTEAERIPRALPRSRLDRALQNLYDSRSGYVHQLKTVHEQLKMPSLTADFIDWEHNPYFTFAGLVRLTHHVLTTFINRQQVLERENYPNWTSELPGLTRVQLAPEYWVWKDQNFTPDMSRERFSGLLEYLLTMVRSEKWDLIDMSAVMEKIEGLVPTCREKDRLPLVALYWLYHLFTPQPRSGWKDFLQAYKQSLDRCSIEMIAIWPFVSVSKLPWQVEECQSVFANYLAERYRATALNLPCEVESCGMVQIANLHLSCDDSDRFCEWIDRSILEAAGET